MLRSLYAGVSGMKSQQKKMDVISNNIANVSTTGFKSGRVRFEDMMSEITSPARESSAVRGGVNTQQIGLGVQISGTDTIMSSGSLQPTGRSLDFGIQNSDSSFFVVSETEDGSSVNQYTRDGGFFIDGNDQLVTATGMRVMGYPVDGENIRAIEIPKTRIEGGQVTTLQSYNIDNDGRIHGVYDNGETYSLGRLALASFSNPDGLEKKGGNLYIQTNNSGEPVLGAPSEDGYGSIRSGFLEMSNVDLANEFTDMIVTSRAYQANSRAITTSDEMLQELLNLKR